MRVLFAIARLIEALFVYRGATIIRRAARGHAGYRRRKHSDWS